MQRLSEPRTVFMSLPGQPMDEGQMFQPPSQHISLKQQVIALSQSYPCPRCTPGVLEPFGHTETMACNSCKRSFVPLRGGRLLYPANRLGWKIAPTFWWDGYRWHWGGTTATTKQLSMIVMASLLPVLGIICTATLQTAWWQGTLKCDTHQAGLISALVGLVSMQLIYFFCWDFEFYRSKK